MSAAKPTLPATRRSSVRRRDGPSPVPSIVITSCTNRKRRLAPPALCARSLGQGELGSLWTEWRARLSSADDLQPASQLYCGRGFREAERAAALAEAKLFVVSAGLGLLEASTPVPAYSLTLGRQTEDAIFQRAEGVPGRWWSLVRSGSPFSTDLPSETGLILAALPRPYMELVAEDWAGWPAERRARLRLFSKGPSSGLPERLRGAWMPYDDRLERAPGDHAGTQGDFAQRALRHFVEHGMAREGGDAFHHASQVREALEPLTSLSKPLRERRTDEQLVELIQREWQAVGGRSGEMLRHLRRGVGVACEQSRFKDLFKRAAALRAERGFPR